MTYNGKGRREMMKSDGTAGSGDNMSNPVRK